MVSQAPFQEHCSYAVVLTLGLAQQQIFSQSILEVLEIGFANPFHVLYVKTYLQIWK